MSYFLRPEEGEEESQDVSSQRPRPISVRIISHPPSYLYLNMRPFVNSFQGRHAVRAVSSIFPEDFKREKRPARASGSMKYLSASSAFFRM